MKNHKDTHAARTTIKYSLVALLLIGIAFSPLSAQNRKDLEEKRKQLLEEINQTNTLLDKTKKDKARVLDRYFALQNQIQKRQRLIKNLRTEIQSADLNIVQANQILVTLKSDLGRLKTEYVSTMRTALRHQMGNSMVLFLFSADSFNNAFQRWQYIRQYYRYRKKQMEDILATQEELTRKAAELAQKKTEKRKLLDASQQQQSTLNVELADKDRLVKNLKTDESKLITELTRQQKSHDDLNRTIENVIRTEIAKKKKESRKPEALSPTTEKEEALAAADIGLSNDFRSKKGKLPSPVAQGHVTRPFGTQPHPTLKGLKINNNGVDIRTDNSFEVNSVFDGTVVGTQFVPGYQNTIIVQHGQYYTVYSNIEEVLVKRGEKITASQVIGKLSQDKPEVHFEVWREKERLNPIGWIVQ